MDEIEYFDRLEEAAIAKGIGAAVQAIFNEYFGPDHGRTMADLQRIAYKHTDAGVSVGFLLFDGSFVWKGDRRANDPALIDAIQDICIGAIVEGSDIDIDPVCLDLLKIADGSDEECLIYPDQPIEEMALRRWYKKLEEVNQAACDLWQELQSEGLSDE